MRQSYKRGILIYKIRNIVFVCGGVSGCWWTIKTLLSHVIHIREMPNSHTVKTCNARIRFHSYTYSMCSCSGLCSVHLGFLFCVCPSLCSSSSSSSSRSVRSTYLYLTLTCSCLLAYMGIVCAFFKNSIHSQRNVLRTILLFHCVAAAAVFFSFILEFCSMFSFVRCEYMVCEFVRRAMGNLQQYATKFAIYACI